MKSFVDIIRDQLDSWGILLPRAGKAAGERIVVLLADGSGAERLVGFLSQEDDGFVFRYSKEFREDPRAVPISAFPDLEETYRAEKLWPFFAVRIPPSDRDDVRETMARRKLSEDEPLKLLASLARRVATSPYELRMAS